MIDDERGFAEALLASYDALERWGEALLILADYNEESGKDGIAAGLRWMAYGDGKEKPWGPKRPFRDRSGGWWMWHCNYGSITSASAVPENIFAAIEGHTWVSGVMRPGSEKGFPIGDLLESVLSVARAYDQTRQHKHA